MRFVNTVMASCMTSMTGKILAVAEWEKKSKYLASLHAQRKDFTPMVYTVDGIAGRKVKSVEKHFASFLAEKRKREYSKMVFYVQF